MPRNRVLIIDEDLPRRLATELDKRGRSATTVAALGFAGAKDPALLADLTQLGPVLEWVLVTGDDAMPWEHSTVLTDTGATIATVDPRRPKGITQDAWRRDVVHRWGHTMQLQEPGSVRRYSFAASREWTPRKRHLGLGG
jgi:hypothetical protein